MFHYTESVYDVYWATVVSNCVHELQVLQYCSTCLLHWMYSSVYPCFVRSQWLFTLECLADDLHVLLLKSELKHTANNGLKFLHVIRVVWSIRRFIWPPQTSTHADTSRTDYGILWLLSNIFDRLRGKFNGSCATRISPVLSPLIRYIASP